MSQLTNEQAELQKEIERLRKQKEGLKRELDALTSSVADCKAKLDAAGADLGIWQHRQASAGEWSRHFSTVRMTVTPFLFTTSLAVLAFKWDDREATFIVAASVTWAAGMFLLLIFTYFTHASATTQDYYDSLLPRGPAEKKRWGSHAGWPWNWWRRNWLLDMGFLTGLALTVCFIAAINRWREKTPETRKEPATLPTVRLEVPPTLPTINIQAPTTFPHVQFDVPTTLPSIGMTAPASGSPPGPSTTTQSGR